VSIWLRTLGWLVTVAALAIYAVMMTVTLPHLTALAGGLPMFDMRPGGYDFETAKEILTGLGIEGRNYYIGVQHILDALFPPLIALAVAYWLWRAAPRWRRAGLPMSTMALGLLMGFAFLSSALDLTENLMVENLLHVGPDNVTPSMVNVASQFTLAKSVTATIAYSALLVVGLGPFVARLLGRGRD